MNKYNKDEKILETKQAGGIRNAIKHNYWTRFFAHMAIVVLLLFLLLLLCLPFLPYLFTDLDNIKIDIIDCIWLYLILSPGCICLLHVLIIIKFHCLKGKLEYTDTTLHYEGYTGFFLRKTTSDLSFSEIAHIHIYTDHSVKGGELIMSVCKKDGTTTRLKIGIFNIKDIAKVMHCQLLYSANALSIQNVHKYRITIHNYKVFIWGYLKLDVFVNEEKNSTSESTYTVDVKTGDILAIKREEDIHIFRLQDPSLTHYHIDDSMNAFKVITAKE